MAGAWRGSVQALGSSLSHRLPTCSCGSHLACAARALPQERERLKRGVPKLEAALPSRLDDSPVRAQETAWNRRHRGWSSGWTPQVSNHRVMCADESIVGTGRFGTDRAGYRALLASVRAWPARCGRSKAATGSAGTSRCGCWPTASRSSTCHRSCPRGCVSSPPVKVARPTPPTRTPSPWSAPGWPGCARWSTTNSSPCCGSCVDRRAWNRPPGSRRTFPNPSGASCVSSPPLIPPPRVPYTCPDAGYLWSSMTCCEHEDLVANVQVRAPFCQIRGLQGNGQSAGSSPADGRGASA